MDSLLMLRSGRYVLGLLLIQPIPDVFRIFSHQLGSKSTLLFLLFEFIIFFRLILLVELPFPHRVKLVVFGWRLEFVFWFFAISS